MFTAEATGVAIKGIAPVMRQHKQVGKSFLTAIAVLVEVSLIET